jgi:serine/threonine protein kinase
MCPMIGRTVGNYRLIREIGFGGMGKVYAGVDLSLKRPVAIKVLRPELAADDLVVERFRSEAITLAGLNHPNIATVHAFFDFDETWLLVMEYARGWTLTEVVATKGALAPITALGLFNQALRGVGYAHAQGVVHRDIKPANFILTDTGLLKTLDFGIARVLGTARMTRTGKLIGTLEYMSPEHIKGLETDSRSDIYSLGILLYELLTGHTPFEGHSDYKLMQAQVEERPSLSSELSAQFPDGLEVCILQALEKDPSKRFETTANFATALSATVKGNTDQSSLVAELSRVSPLPPYPRLTDVPPDTRIARTSDAPSGPISANAKAELTSARTERSLRLLYTAIALVAVTAISVGTLLIRRLPDEFTMATIAKPETTNSTSSLLAQAAEPEASTPGDDDAPRRITGNSQARLQNTTNNQLVPQTTETSEPRLTDAMKAKAQRIAAPLTNSPSKTPAVEDETHELSATIPSDSFVPASRDSVTRPVTIAIAPNDLATNNPLLGEVEIQEQIANLAKLADQAFNELRLTTPKERSALHYYQQILALKPNSVLAEQGIKRIVGKYTDMAIKAWQNGQDTEKESYLNRAFSIAPKDPKLVEAMKRVHALGPLTGSSSTAGANLKVPAINYPNISSAKLAYKERKISKSEYRRIKNYYANLIKKKIRQLKDLLKKGEISKYEYKQQARKIKLKYKG